MKIKLDFEKKEIEVIGKVIVIDLFEKIEELGLDVNEWNFVTKAEFIYNNSLNTYITAPHHQPKTPYQPNKVWY